MMPPNESRQQTRKAEISLDVRRERNQSAGSW